MMLFSRAIRVFRYDTILIDNLLFFSRERNTNCRDLRQASSTAVRKEVEESIVRNFEMVIWTAFC